MAGGKSPTPPWSSSRSTPSPDSARHATSPATAPAVRRASRLERSEQMAVPRTAAWVDSELAVHAYAAWSPPNAQHWAADGRGLNPQSLCEPLVYPNGERRTAMTDDLPRVFRTA